LVTVAEDYPPQRSPLVSKTAGFWRSAYVLLNLGRHFLSAQWIGWRSFDPDRNLTQWHVAYGHCGIFASLD
jgi:hypothetical protein